MAEITLEHLERLGERLETSFRRETDLLRMDLQRTETGLYKRIDELAERQDQQRARVEVVEKDLGKVREDVRVLSHDFRQHIDKHVWVGDRGIGAKHGADSYTRRQVTAGITLVVTILIAALAGIAQAWDFLQQLLKHR